MGYMKISASKITRYTVTVSDKVKVSREETFAIIKFTHNVGKTVILLKKRRTIIEY